MLNEKVLSEIFNQTFPKLIIKDVHWKTQDSNTDSLLFYRLGKDQKSQDLFRERVNHSTFGWLILNADHPERPLNSLVVGESDWPRIQKSLMDILYPLPALKLLAVTGTNGKTTTADLILQIGELCGKKGLSMTTRMRLWL